MVQFYLIEQDLKPLSVTDEEWIPETRTPGRSKFNWHPCYIYTQSKEICTAATDAPIHNVPDSNRKNLW